MFSSCLRLAALVTVLALPTMMVEAAETAPAAQLADACSSCHGIDGRSTGAIPPLAGQSRDDLIAKLTAFRDGENLTIMNRLARGYSDDEIAALADYFSSVEATP